MRLKTRPRSPDATIPETTTMNEHAMTSITRTFVLLTLMGTTAGAIAASCGVSSAPTRTPLITLYTSEGCSSCPPADRWLSQLTTRSDIVALAFHVDYWDYIGWKDRFGDPRNTARQREWARATHTRTIYTPQILVNGKDAFLWRTKDPLVAPNKAAPAPRSPPGPAAQRRAGSS